MSTNRVYEKVINSLMTIRKFKYEILSVAVGLALVGIVQTKTDSSGLLVAWESEGSEGQPLVGESAPDFTGKTTQGKVVSLSEFGGEQAVVVFVTESCGSCQDLIQQMASLSELPENLLVIYRGSDEGTRLLEDTQKGGVRILKDTEGTINRIYEISTVPQVYVINSEGKIEISMRGMPLAWKTIKSL